MLQSSHLLRNTLRRIPHKRQAAYSVELHYP